MKLTELNGYKVKAIKYRHGEYRLGSNAEIVDEGSFYRVDGSHIFDKFKIISTEINGNELTIVMKDKTVLLEVEEKRSVGSYIKHKKEKILSVFKAISSDVNEQSFIETFKLMYPGDLELIQERWELEE